ncbi:hypothetical protein [Jeotgalibacillus haloalkalitolerans]|uniref:PepSY domain-containing protein n=1 Tax=Jeotgalibacillus haloalkalitolerans TaxID=3104292 RepID=A0ABU5KNL9_9BACL|nr:hypothetical protein [Jeotgalibacillus sp. HH7-29]MDZ5712678.1 hypothetical protein [Jeotgalibacillus sp. HH7-29]
MKKICWYLTVSTFAALMLVGCSNEQTEETKSETGQYIEAKEAAWNYVKEQNWDDTAEEDWQNAEVTEVVADQSYEVLDEHFEGETALRVTFNDKGTVLTGTPSILIDPETNAVIGYVPTE